MLLPRPATILGLGPRGWSPAEGRAALVGTCHIASGTVSLGLPSLLISQLLLSQGSRRKSPVPGSEEDRGLSSPKAASGLRVT